MYNSLFLPGILYFSIKTHHASVQIIIRHYCFIPMHPVKAQHAKISCTNRSMAQQHSKEKQSCYMIRLQNPRNKQSGNCNERSKCDKNEF